jgi:hypothetical protein
VCLGSALYANELGSLLVADSTFSFNSVTGTAGAGQLASWRLAAGAGGAAGACSGTPSPSSSPAGGALTTRQVKGVVLSNVVFSDNAAAEAPGAVSISDAQSGSLQNCTFERNTARGGPGAVLLRRAANASFLGCSFMGQQGSGEGGALLALESTAVALQNCDFRDNNGKRAASPSNHLATSGAQARLRDLVRKTCTTACINPARCLERRLHSMRASSDWVRINLHRPKPAIATCALPRRLSSWTDVKPGG